MSRTVFCPEEVIVVSKGKGDIGRLVALGNDGKFDTSVIPVIDDLQTQITVEVTARSEADTQLQANVDAETLARTNADAKLQNNVDVEASARSSADQDLQDKITEEVTARTNADNQLQTSIDAEITTRIDADQDLQDQMSKEVAARTDGNNALQSSVDSEVIARTNADEAESSTRASTDKDLQEQLDVLKGKNTFSNVVVNGTTIQADSQTDTIELKTGTNISLTADATNKKVTIAVTGKVESAAQADTAVVCTGNAATVTKLETARTINGVSFDGTADITISTSGIPSGAVQYFAMQVAPKGWLIADGTAILRTEYADLFAAIGTQYGTGDDSTTFNLPDLRGEFIRGFDEGRGIDSSRVFASLQNAQANHLDKVYYSTESGNVGSTTLSEDGSVTNYVRTGNGTGWGLAFKLNGVETRPRNVALLACIKY